ncbi:FxSxx-COOH system tetratricopeptide repeat protein [Actinoplanes italicus]|nr:FxSxx-COOH system tetratricopeptide repeat protein [Actinoplanes italicus]
MPIVISHAGADRAWAEWARWHLEAAGYPTELDSVDRAPGTNAVEAMDRALHRDNPMLALLSAAYLKADRFTTDEWTARWAQRRGNPDVKLIPLRVEKADLSGGLWAPIVVPDLFDLVPAQAVSVLLDAVRRVLEPAPAGPLTAAPPDYPGRAVAAGPRPPGSLPPVWNLARRNPGFTGRDGMLGELYDTLRGGSRVAVQALHGLGGVGKTQLALEYAHRFAGEYDLVWWIPSEQPELIGDHLAALARQLCLVPVDTPTPAAADALQEHLRRTDRWLLVFDNADDRDHLAPWLPDGPGHLLITSRNPNWTGVARPMDVDVFTRAESVALLRAHLPHLDGPGADRLAEALGDLPLAVGQAADLLVETRLSADDYLRELTAHMTDPKRESRPPAGYPLPLAAAVTLTAERLLAADPAAGQLLHLCARLGPEPIPTDLFTSSPDELPQPLRAAAAGTVMFSRVLAQLTRYGLARPTAAGPILHRLVRAVLRDTDPDPYLHRRVVEELLVAARPDDGSDPRWWPRWSVLLPHILAADPATTGYHQLRYTACSAVWSLLARGDFRAALPLAEQLHRAWQPDEDSVLIIAHALAGIHRGLGEYEQARDLDQDNLARERRRRGADDARTLNAAHNLATDLRHLREFERARELDENTLARRRRLFGGDDPQTLASASSLAIDLCELKEHEQARRLSEETLEKYREQGGDDHPATLTTANILGVILRRSGEHEKAWQLNRDTWDRRRRLLGDDHPDTLTSANNLAADLRELGEFEQAREIDEDTLERKRRVLGNGHPQTDRSIENLARDLDALGRYAEAAELRRELRSEP